MADPIKIVKGDTRPQIKAVLKDADTGQVIDLTASTQVLLKFRRTGAAALTATLTGTLLTGLENDDGSITTTAPYNVAGYGGRVVFNWGANDLANIEPGPYEGEIEITFTDGSKQTVFDVIKFKARDDF